MIINTKFEVGNFVYIIYDNKCCNVEIRKIYVTAEDHNPNIEYLLCVSNKNDIILPENQIFRTKEDLLKSL